MYFESQALGLQVSLPSHYTSQCTVEVVLTRIPFLCVVPTESPGCRFLSFRDVIVCSSSRVQRSKKRFLGISTLVRCEKGLRGEYKIRISLRKLYVTLRTGIHLAQKEVCGNRVACWKLVF